jgi:predicted flavoprotein YhiN
MSKSIGETMQGGEVALGIDLLAKTDLQALDKEVLAVFADSMNKKIKNVLGGILPAKIAAVALAQAGIDPEKFVNLVSREERLALVARMKDVRLTVSHLLGKEDAIVSSGGVDPAEIDMRTMRSKINPRVFAIGDALNFNRPSGGFSLQVCWTTGYLAGENAPLPQ